MYNMMPVLLSIGLRVQYYASNNIFPLNIPYLTATTDVILYYYHRYGRTKIIQ